MGKDVDNFWGFELSTGIHKSSTIRPQALGLGMAFDSGDFGVIHKSPWSMTKTVFKIKIKEMNKSDNRAAV